MSDADDGSARDLVRERLDGLLRLRNVNHKPTEQTIRENLGKWLAEGGHGGVNIRVRRSFVARVPPPTEKEIAAAGEITDYRKSNLVRVPPLAVLTALPRGVGLRCALTLLFLVQTHRAAALGSQGLVKIPIDDDDAPFDLLRLIAIPARYHGGPSAKWGGGARANRQRQIREALKRLADDDLKMIALPPGGQGVPRFKEVHLRNETGAAISEPSPYTVPKPHVPTVDIPTTFFTNGWIHALTNREIAMWLMIRDLTAGADPAVTNAAIEGVPAPHWDRLTLYHLRKRTADTSRELEAFGLVEVIRDEENRRADGTTRGGIRAAPNRYRLTDAGLQKPALTAVIKHLKAQLKP